MQAIVDNVYGFQEYEFRIAETWTQRPDNIE